LHSAAVATTRLRETCPGKKGSGLGPWVGAVTMHYVFGAYAFDEPELGHLRLDSPQKKGYGRGSSRDSGECWACWGSSVGGDLRLNIMRMHRDSATGAPAAHLVTINPSLDG
jgi:hypothetical protein